MTSITRRQFFAGFAALAALAVTPEPAEATPRKFRNCPKVTQNGITYMLYQRCAIVTKTPNRQTVTIPDSIRHSGKTYTVRSIWDHTIEICPKIRRIVLKARSLEAIEDPAIFEDRRIMVICYDRSTYAWLRRSGVNARKHF